MDQRKVNVLAREYCDTQVKKLKDPIAKEKWKKKPIVLSHRKLIFICLKKINLYWTLKRARKGIEISSRFCNLYG